MSIERSLTLAEAALRAEARSQKVEQRQADARKVMADIEARRIAEMAKTARLRALRLAKEEAERQAEAAAPKLRAKGRKRSPQSRPAGHGPAASSTS